MDTEDKAIILFDGSCGLCNRSVKFVLRHERSQALYFSPLQSEFGKSLLEKHNLSGKADSVVLIKNNKAYVKSAAALRITAFLKGLWPLLMVFLAVPPFIRNGV
ncbi:MAG: thiol-disulfide oxidoreductase DCC family protein, partial [Bacteroidia bacterium]